MKETMSTFANGNDANLCIYPQNMNQYIIVTTKALKTKN